MYDFYKNPPKTKSDLSEWLTDWLEPVTSDHTIEKDGEIFKSEFGFRRASYVHSVLKNIKTNEYVWWVDEFGDLKNFPTQRFPDYETMLQWVIDDYYTRWHLTE